MILHRFTEIEPPLWCFNGDGIRIPGQELKHVFEEISSLCHWINRKKSLNQQRCGNDVPDPNRNAKNGDGKNTDAEQLEWTWKSTMYILNYATKVIYRKRMEEKKNIMIEPAKHEKMVRCISTQDMQLPEWTMLDPQFSGEIPMKISDSGYPMAISDSLTIFSLNSRKSICVDCKTSIYTGFPNISLPCLKFKPWKFMKIPRIRPVGCSIPPRIRAPARASPIHLKRPRSVLANCLVVQAAEHDLLN